MPELPEVETIARELRPLLVGRTITSAWFDWPRPDQAPCTERVRGADHGPRRSFRSTAARSGSSSRSPGQQGADSIGDEAVLAIQVKMTGYLACRGAQRAAPTSTCTSGSRSTTATSCACATRANSGAWVSIDATRRGRCWGRGGERALCSIRPRASRRRVHAGRFPERIRRRKARLKTLLMDQDIRRRRGQYLRRRGAVAGAAPPVAQRRRA